jgi:Mrp family chromosome partitioning ATPase
MSLTDDALRKLQREGFFAVVPPTTPSKESEPQPIEELDGAGDTVPVEGLSDRLHPAQKQELPVVDVSDSAPNEAAQTADVRDHHSVPDLSEPIPSSDGRAAYDPVIPSFDELAPADDDASETESARDAVTDSEWIDGLELGETFDETDLGFTDEEDRSSANLPESMPPWSEMDDPVESGTSEQELPEATMPSAGLDPVESSEQSSPENASDPVATSRVDESENHEDVVDSRDELSSAATHEASETYEQTLLHRLDDPAYAQPFHHFQQNLLRTCGTELPSSLLVVSPTATARSAETVCHLALIWEESEDEILLVDANLEQQALTRAFHAIGQPGLCDILGQQSEPDDVVRCTSRPRLHFVPSGDDRFGVSRVPDKVDPKGLADLLETWCRQYQRVFIDCGSIESLLMPALAESCDASLLVVCLRDVTFSQLENAAERLRGSSRRVLGCVLTDGLTDLSGQS